MQSRLAKKFSNVNVSVVQVGELNTWVTNSIGPIRETLRRATIRARCWKADNKVLFSANHLTALVSESLNIVAAQKRRFNYIEASRSAHPVALDLADHLLSFARFAIAGSTQV